MAITIKKKLAAPPKGVPMQSLYIAPFGVSETSPGTYSKEDFGGKGANLIEMSKIGVPVPPGFVFPCHASIQYRNYTEAEQQEYVAIVVERAIQGMALLTYHFGYTPLVSVRSGARVSMPGMMDTILNVGLTTESLPMWRERLGTAALDSYRRLIQMYSSVALGIPLSKFEEALDAIKEEGEVKSDAELSEAQLEQLIDLYLSIVAESNQEFPSTLQGQLEGAILAVFKSWDNPRAVTYRKMNGYSDDWGTAVTIQSMVFGNLNDQSATGVVFTRCPSTGLNQVTGEFLINAQGEDVVAGIRTPEPMAKLAAWNSDTDNELYEVLTTLELHYRDMQDVEFTVQDGKLFILQTRNAKRSPKAAFEIAHDMVEEGIIEKEEAINRVTQEQLFMVMQDSIDPAFTTKPNFSGIAAGGGVVTGVAVFSSADAVNCTEPCILVTKETDPDDIEGINASVGILTATGGLTSHAAVVARGMNKTCVVGCTDMEISMGYAMVTGQLHAFKAGSKITLDGATGNVWVDTDVPLIVGGADEKVMRVLSWAAGEGVSHRIDYHMENGTGGLYDALQGSTSQSIYLDTALIDQACYAALEPLQNAMECVGDLLEEFKGSEIILDLRGIDDYLSDEDRMFSWTVSTPELSYEGVLRAKLYAIKKWSAALQSKLLLRLPDTSKEVKALASTIPNVKVAGKVANMADLLNMTGPAEVSDEVISSVFGTMDVYLKVRDMVEKSTGKSISTSLRPPVYWYESLRKA